MEEWVDFQQWRQEKGLALSQDLSNFTDRIRFENPNQKDDLIIRLVVIGLHEEPGTIKLTLLDLTQDYFSRNQHLMTADYNQELDVFELVWGPVRSDNVYHGLMKTLKALRDEL